ncbi:MarR family winged helix-turn-helix transcriptional regulator [Yonghaparkia sp. Soil809]|uniref:MarR family winged helix-turn-helix transcriptional regulator n=1 Tax=Yonghaparkia sp. Soil809 TaxID=1736417 RepID=UPI000B027C88|nr:MarR family transcriptional regulator [Yonghaparkia sp. Soil809]
MSESVEQPPGSVPPAAAAQPPGAGSSHAATLLLRELLDVTEDFERSLGDDLSVNPTDLKAMQHLIVAGALSPTALAERLELSSGAVTTVIDRLEGLGHVRRTPNPDDRRGTLVVPERASVARAMGRILPMVSEVDRTIHAFDEQEQAVITRYLERVVATYRGHAGASDRTRSWRADAPPPPSAGASPTR